MLLIRENEPLVNWKGFHRKRSTLLSYLFFRFREQPSSWPSIVHFRISIVSCILALLFSSSRNSLERYFCESNLKDGLIVDDWSWILKLKRNTCLKFFANGIQICKIKELACTITIGQCSVRTQKRFNDWNGNLSLKKKKVERIEKELKNKREPLWSNKLNFSNVELKDSVETKCLNVSCEISGEKRKEIVIRICITN